MGTFKATIIGNINFLNISLDEAKLIFKRSEIKNIMAITITVTIMHAVK